MRRLERHRKPALPKIDNLATIVVPSRYPDIFEGCQFSLSLYAPRAPKTLVRDGDAIGDPEGWNVIQGPPGAFCYARNVNLGIQACSGDVLLLNDDCQFTQAGTLEALQGVFALRPDLGILSPNVEGVATGVEYTRALVQETKGYLSFVCVLIRRALIEKIGLLDENYVGYGSEDVDFCRRAQVAGFTLGVTSMATVFHKHASSSYSREPNQGQRWEAANNYYMEKWGKKTQGHYADEN